MTSQDDTRDADGPGIEGPELGQALVRGWLTQPMVAVVVMDPRLRIVRTNLHLVGTGGYTHEHFLGKPFTEVLGFVDPATEVAVTTEVLRTGVPAVQRLVRSTGGGLLRTFSVSLFRLESARGTVLGVAAVAVDVTAREAARTRVEQGAAISARVGSSLDVVTTCRTLAEAAAAGFADQAEVELLEEVLAGGPLRPGPPPSSSVLRRVALAGPAPAPAGGAPPGAAAGRTARPAGRRLADPAARLGERPGPAPGPGGGRRTAAAPAGAAGREITVPLAAGDLVLGLATFRRSDVPFVEDDLPMAETVAAHAALCLTNALRYTRELTTAATIRRRSAPEQPQLQAALETAYHSVRGGGADRWYDVIGLPGGRTVLVLGTVAGEGVQTAATMGQLRTVVQALAELDLDPEELLDRLDAAVRRLPPSGDRAGPVGPAPLVATCVLALFDPFEGSCVVCRAGQAGPTLVSPDGSAVVPAVPEAGALGAPERVPFVGAAVPAGDGTVFVFHTGGAATPSAAGDAAAGPRGEEGALGALAERMAGHLLRRDEGGAVLLARVGAFPPDAFVEAELPFGPEAARAGRAVVARALGAWGVDEDSVFAMELIASELVTNAVRYGAAPVLLRLVLDRGLTCEVHDLGRAAPRLRHARRNDEGGRGLFIVSELADRWGTRYVGDRKVIWALREGAVRGAHR